MNFVNTRCKEERVTSSKAIINGIASHGGLYVPESFPKIDDDFLKSLQPLEYYERSAKVLALFLTDFTYEELLSYTKSAYARFDGEPAPTVKIDKDLFILELFHGPTCAFKDIALTLLPHLLVGSKNKQGMKEDIKILVATSGDTGKAALEGFKDVANTSINVLYPIEGVSDVQKLQMTTQEGNNVYVAGVEGNFDDCQNTVKKLFAIERNEKKLFNDGIILSSANSINFGRLAPQIVYYFSSYCDLVEAGEIKYGDRINFTVPTGNFGNILAGYYAKLMGLPINKLICASNCNNVLTDFFNTGKYNKKREFNKTISPSMDILISSNLERLLFEMADRNVDEINSRMTNLEKTGVYQVDKAEHDKYNQSFYAGFATDLETKDAISTYFDEYDYPLDTHTAVACKVYFDYQEATGDETPNVIVSTASPYKFAQDVAEAITEEPCSDAFKAIEIIHSETSMEVPSQINELKTKKVRFKDVFNQNNLDEIIKK